MHESRARIKLRRPLAAAEPLPANPGSAESKAHRSHAKSLECYSSSEKQIGITARNI